MSGDRLPAVPDSVPERMLPLAAVNLRGPDKSNVDPLKTPVNSK